MHCVSIALRRGISLENAQRTRRVYIEKEGHASVADQCDTPLKTALCDTGIERRDTTTDHSFDINILYWIKYVLSDSSVRLLVVQLLQYRMHGGGHARVLLRMLVRET